MKQIEFHFPSRFRLFSTATSLFVATAISGCAVMHDQTATVSEIDLQKIGLADNITLSRDGWPEAQWWNRYHDKQLNTLIEHALKDAPAIEIAEQRVRASDAQASLVDANGGLLVGFAASIDRQDLSANSFLGPFTQNIPSAGLTGPWYTEGTIGLKASYSFDVWGKDRAKTNAALGLRNAQKAEAAEVELLLSARVTQLYYAIQAVYASLDLLTESRDIENELVAAHQTRADRGLEPHNQTEIAQTRKIELNQQISTAENKIAILRETMRALLGAGPHNLPAIKSVALPENVGALPPALGYQLLARRPDLQAMRWVVQASMQQVDVAKAAFYPEFDIKTFFGLDALHLGDLLHVSSKQINLVPGLSLPIFDNGRLDAGLANARAQNNLAIAHYNQSVLDAVSEIARIGIELHNGNTQTQLQLAKLKAVSFSKDSAEAHYKQGLTDKLTALNATLPVLAEQGKLIELRSWQINREVALTMSLGGGYNEDTHSKK